MSSPGFSLSLGFFPIFPFLGFEGKVVAVLPLLKEGLPASAGQQQYAPSTGLWEEMGSGRLNTSEIIAAKQKEANS